MAIRFVIPEHCRTAPKRFDNAHWIGQGRFVGPVDGSIDGSGQYVIADVPRCGRHLQLPWPVAGMGEVYVQAPQLMERSQPYRLTVELARGQMAQTRELLEKCHAQGATAPPEADARMKAACEILLRAIREPSHDAADVLANQALRQAACLAEELTKAVCGKPRSDCQIGVVVDGADCWDYPLGDFQHYSLPVRWSEIEPVQGEYRWDDLDRRIASCRRRKKAFTVGPLICFRRESLPDWLWSWSDDRELVITLMNHFVETVIHRYAAKVGSWETTAGINAEDLFDIGEECAAGVLCHILRVAHDYDPDAEFALAIDQPYGDYLIGGRRRFSPHCLIDCMLRSAPPVHALNLLVESGGAGSVANRSLPEFSRMLDHYGELGLPLRVTLCRSSVSGPSGGQDSEAAQADWLEKRVQVAAAKPFVERVVWGALVDDASSALPGAGLFDADGQEKPAFERIRAIARQCSRQERKIAQ